MDSIAAAQLAVAVSSQCRIRQRSLQRVDAEAFFHAQRKRAWKRAAAEDPLSQNLRPGECRRWLRSWSKGNWFKGGEFKERFFGIISPYVED